MTPRDAHVRFGLCGASALAVLFVIAPVMTGTIAPAEDESRKKIEQAFDRYAAQAKDMTRRAQTQVQQLQNDATALMDRWASEVTTKPLYPIQVNGIQFGCYQPGTPNTPVPPVYFSSAKFEAWKKTELSVFAQMQKQLDVNLKYFLAVLDYGRQRLDQIDAEAARYGHGGDWRASHYQGLRASMAGDPNSFFSTAYRTVIIAYIELLGLHQSEIYGSSAKLKGEHEGPPGQTCVIEATESNQDYTDHLNIYQAIGAGPNWSVPTLTAGGPASEATAACATGEQNRRDAAVNQLRPVRDRYFAERSAIRDRMLAWRKEAVGANFYDGTGDAAVSAVYRTEADLSADNVYGFHVIGYNIWHLRVFPRSHAQSPVDYEVQTIDSGFDLGLVEHSLGTVHTTINLDTHCIEFETPGIKLTAKYQDFESTQPFVLSIPASSPMIREGMASGAGKTERP